MLLHERSLGAASPLQQYIADLPSRVDTPLHWAPAELAQLQYPPVAREVRRRSPGPSRRFWGEGGLPGQASSPV